MAQSKEGLSAEAGQYVMPSRFVESDSVEVQDFVSSALRDLPADAIDRDKAIRLFEAVRDGIRYDPYCFALDEDSYRASRIAGAEAAFCVPRTRPNVPRSTRSRRESVWARRMCRARSRMGRRMS